MTFFDQSSKLKYSGEFKSGHYHGLGTLYHANGRPEYEGSFYNGTLQGQGRVFNDQGKLLLEGIFHQGDFSSGKMFDSEGHLMHDGPLT